MQEYYIEYYKKKQQYHRQGNIGCYRDVPRPLTLGELQKINAHY